MEEFMKTLTSVNDAINTFVWVKIGLGMLRQSAAARNKAGTTYGGRSV